VAPSSVIVRKPKGGDLRGAKLTELMAADVDAVARVIPRITTPRSCPTSSTRSRPTIWPKWSARWSVFLNKAQREAMASMAGG
jgi:hypothetical protein